MQLVLKEFRCCNVPDLDWVNVLQDLLAYEIVMCFYDQFFLTIAWLQVPDRKYRKYVNVALCFAENK